VTLFSSLKRLQDWQLFLLAHGLFAAVALSVFLLGIGLFSGVGLGHAYSFLHLNTIDNLLSGTTFMNRLNLNGFPSFIPYGFALNPVSYVFTTLLPPFTDLHWLIWAMMTSGGVLCSIFLRKLGYSREGSIVGGAAFMTGNWWLVVTQDYTPVMPLVPLVALVLLQSRTNPVWASVWGSLLSAFIWLAVNTQVSFMTFTVFGFGALALAFQNRKQGRNALRPIGVLAVSVIIGTILGIPKFIPSYVYGMLSWRALGVDVATATAEGIQPLTFITYLFPYISFPFVNFGGELVQIFIGAFGFAFLIIGLVIAFRKNAPRTLRWWVLAYALILGLAVANSPLAAILHSIPPFTFFRGAGRWTMMASFVVAPIVAAGFDALVQDKAENIRAKLALFFGWLAGGLLVLFGIGQITLVFFPEQLIAFFQKYFAHFHASLNLGQPLSYYNEFVEHRIAELGADPLFLQPRALLPFLALLVLAIVLQTRIWDRLRNRAVTLACLCLLTTAVSLIFYDKYFPRSALDTPQPVIEFLRKNPGTVLTLLPNETATEMLRDHRFTKKEEVEWMLGHLVPNTNLFSGIHTLDYFDNIAARRQTALAAWVGATWVPAPDEYRLASMDGTLDEKMKEFLNRASVLDLQGVKYVLSTTPLPAPFTKVFESTTAPGDLPLVVYENHTTRPFAYFAYNIVTMEEHEPEAFRRIAREYWPGHRSLLECAPTCDPKEPDGNGTIDVTKNTPAHVVIQTQTESAQWLIVTLSNLPGWKVLLDGEEITPVFANGAFFGIPVPAGTHIVELRFCLCKLIYQGISDLIREGI